ncbi:MAG: hypothetical protein IJV06_09460 [Bacteroidaceae bacterium]|nr:hypothetical protein [Bacteroidaceae bacterium]
MRHSKAARLNRNMMLMTMMIAIIVLGCVFAFMYLSFPSSEQAEEEAVTLQEDTLSLPSQ